MSLRTVARGLVYLLLFLLTLEGLARLDDWLREGASPLRNHDIEAIFHTEPGRKVGIPGAHFGKWHMNSLGYRGPEPQPGRINVITYGASETFGVYESPEQEYPRQLERLLNEGAARAHNVVNIAVPGLRIGRMAYLDQAMRQLQPAYVVVYATPAAYIGVDKPFCQPDEAKASPSQATPATSDAASQPWRWRLAGKLDLVFKKTAPAWLMTRMKEAGIWYASRKLTVQPRVDDAAVQALRTDLQCVIDHVRAQGARPVLVTHATLFGQAVTPETHAMLVAWRRFYPDLAEAGFLDLERRANQATRELAARQADVLLVDGDQAVSPGAAHFADFVHFTDLGAREMAAAIATVLRRDEAARGVASRTLKDTTPATPAMSPATPAMEPAQP